MSLHLSVILFKGGGGRVGFPACITGHMNRGSASGGVCIQREVCIWGGLHGGSALGVGSLCSRGEVCIRGDLHRREGSASRGEVCIWGGLHPGEKVTGFTEIMCSSHKKSRDMNGRSVSTWYTGKLMIAMHQSDVRIVVIVIKADIPNIPKE